MLEEREVPRRGTIGEDALQIKAKKGSAQLLKRLREFHGGDEFFCTQIPDPPIEVPVARALPPMKEPWFSSVEAAPVHEPRSIRVDDIQRAVARRYKVRREDIISARRTARVVKPRQIAMYLAKELTPRSLPDIGRRFGNRDHTTILYGVRKIERLRETDTCLEMDLRTIAAAVGGSLD